MHAFEQEIATESSQVMGLIEDDIGAGEPGVVADIGRRNHQDPEPGGERHQRSPGDGPRGLAASPHAG